MLNSEQRNIALTVTLADGLAFLLVLGFGIGVALAAAFRFFIRITNFLSLCFLSLVALQSVPFAPFPHKRLNVCVVVC